MLDFDSWWKAEGHSLCGGDNLSVYESPYVYKAAQEAWRASRLFTQASQMALFLTELAAAFPPGDWGRHSISIDPDGCKHLQLSVVGLGVKRHEVPCLSLHLTVGAAWQTFYLSDADLNKTPRELVEEVYQLLDNSLKTDAVRAAYMQWLSAWKVRYDPGIPDGV